MVYWINVMRKKINGLIWCIWCYMLQQLLLWPIDGSWDVCGGCDNCDQVTGEQHPSNAIHPQRCRSLVSFTASSTMSSRHSPHHSWLWSDAAPDDLFQMPLLMLLWCLHPASILLLKAVVKAVNVNTGCWRPGIAVSHNITHSFHHILWL